MALAATLPDPPGPLTSAVASDPLFSVVIATHNRADVLPEAIGSVLGQRHADLECIVVDDGSTDATAGATASFDDPRLTCVRQENAGCSTARNHGVSTARGLFVTFLDDDDLARPDWLERFAAEIHPDDPSCLAVCGGAEYLDEMGGHHHDDLPQDLGPLFGNRVGLFWPPGTFAVRRSAFDTVGGYVDGLRAGENYELAVRLTDLADREGAHIHAVRDVVVTHRNDRTGVRVRSHRYAETRLEGVQYLLAHHGERLAAHPALLANHVAMEGMHQARLGRYSKARRAFARAIRHAPATPRYWARLVLAAAPPVARRVWPCR